jgi:magnesium-transporting ATPase (P-type)
VPTLRLGRYEVEEFDPPNVCMKCGAPSRVVVRKTFSWYPPWIAITILVALLVYIILVAVLTKRMTVPVPLCDKHKGHWTKRMLITLLGLLVILAFVGIAIAASTSEGDLADMAGLFWGLVVVALLAWLILIVVLQQTAIRPTEITDRSITLTGVGRGYIEALREERGDSYDDDRPRSRRRDDDDDERPRKRRRLPEDEEDESPRPKAKDRSDGVYDPKKSKRRQEDSEAIQGDDE